MTALLKTTDVRSRIDEQLKAEATSVLQDCGLTISAAIRLFLEQVVQEQGVPFEIKRKQPSAKTAQALKEAALIEQQYSSLDEMMLELTKSESKNKP
ncbi:type II toxin-antitoxin system RelB/DinJ family antitoxin [Providencia sp. JGM181]|jgi:DNA-damage-inducible protein J|uniref:type II toxin-antitoxin system RelB/DinJ family antitoxin n=1 Tax=unclassified Providencia TaxID=2633465 RepID=UPI0012B5B05C|nr:MULTISPECIES: type II toxin-antitoxin system RelB/DinJ family antitoxin [unclassified Providencia]MBS0923754.1 type II toxin-antitoxin system RelB/DinJ family antitoxin [Providencia sp. JGM181]MBS0933860.1 type II toxin-antitoxin system RelB/DinJ family antitoxin [Providencia sp. JGM172]MBS0998573.1 type II toxin-antitoxin system RelB/DinJ family antitoxin [Providencia sp. JGM178]MTB68317.1 type II toxin-antitoxin system RelB/DinJ family antitoxin [Providencia sp. wls1943]MTC70543.1 type II